MKRALTWLLFLAGTALAAWFWTVQASTDPFPAAWQAWRFRDSNATDHGVRQRIAGDRQAQALRLASGGSADVQESAHDEIALWERQFHLGDVDREERLSLQHLDRSGLRRRIEDALQDEAYLESRIPAITEEAARAWYDTNAEELRIPVLHRVSHIFLTRHSPGKPDRRAEIRSIQGELQRGVSFATLAAKHSEDPRSKARGGDLGWLSTARMPQDFMDQVEKLPVGKVSAPVETKLGWHLLLVTERREPRVPAFEEVREEILALLDHERRARFQP